MSESTFFQVWLLVFGTVAYVASLRFLRRYLELRHQRPLADPSADVQERLARIEQAVEATAIEVERISEANRFMAKLLAERGPTPLPQSRPERSITPH